MSEYLLDSDIISAHLRGVPSVTTQLVVNVARLHASVVSLAELTAWIQRKNTPRILRKGLTELIPEIQWESVTEDIARLCGQLRAESYDRGQPLPLMDLLIAATALEYGLIVVTHNLRHYRSIPGLVLEDWLAP